MLWFINKTDSALETYGDFPSLIGLLIPMDVRCSDIFLFVILLCLLCEVFGKVFQPRSTNTKIFSAVPQEQKIDFDLFEYKYIEVSSLLRSQFIVHYFLIKPKFSTCSILPTIFENFFFSQLLSENYEIKKPKRVKANFFDYD